MAQADDDVIRHRPTEAELRAAARVLAPFRAVIRPRFHGLENIPRRGRVLLVGNHTVYGLQDIPLMLAEIHESRGRFVRGLADHAHFRVPVWRDLLTRFGAVRGTRENCGRLMGAGEAVLVFPGGAREVNKRRGERYQLIWKQRLGFARLAIQHRCPIVPFASVGPEESYEVLLDYDHPLAAPVRAVAERLGIRDDAIPPLARGIGLTALPRPQRFYFAFGERIDTRRWEGRHEDERACRTLRDEVRAAVEGLIESLLAEREQDPERDLPSRIAAGARSIGATRTA